MLDNPQWDEIQTALRDGRFSLEADRLLMANPDRMAMPHLNRVCSFFSPTIACPRTLAYLLSAISEDPVIIADAGNGYWSWLLKQAGLDVVAYDDAPWVGPFKPPSVSRLNRKRSQLTHHRHGVLLVVNANAGRKSDYSTVQALLGMFKGPRALLICEDDPFTYWPAGAYLKRDWEPIAVWEAGVIREGYPKQIHHLVRRGLEPEAPVWNQPTRNYAVSP